MALNPDQLLAARIPDIEQHYGWRDCALYSLGIGIGLDPMDDTDLAFLDETRLKVHPAMANVLGYPGFWQRDPAFGLDWKKVVHGEHAFRLHRAMPVEGSVRGVSRIVDLVDKGEGRGALLFVERLVTDMDSGELIATVNQTIFARGDGGFNGEARTVPAPQAIPDRAPDVVVQAVTSPQSALIYRLSGDYNPLHSDPTAARASGFERPILHGLATFGVVCHALMKSLCNSDPAGVRAMSGRFSAPVFPGETLAVEVWREAGAASFRATVRERAAVVVNNGYFEMST
jgi:acyl dehydratase